MGMEAEAEPPWRALFSRAYVMAIDGRAGDDAVAELVEAACGDVSVLEEARRHYVGILLDRVDDRYAVRALRLLEDALTAAG
jgi:hypothetical protein